MKTNTLIYIFIFSLITFLGYSQSSTCSGAEPVCGSADFNYANTTNSGSAENGPDYGCLGMQPNPAWFFLQIDTSGSINIVIQQSSTPGGPATIDVDFILYGPFSAGQNTCDSSLLTAANTVDCSFSVSATETINIANAFANEIYVLLITNFDNDPGFINVEQTSGTGSTDCSIVTDQVACVGDTVTLTPNVTGNSYVWYFNGVVTTNTSQDFIIVDDPNDAIDPSGSYSVDIFNASGVLISQEVFNITFSLDNASFNYGFASYCINETDPLPTITGLAGGTFSTTAGLFINTSTGLIDLSASTAGSTYTVTYTTPNCVNTSTFDVSILLLDDASFNYSSASYCVNETNPLPIITGLVGGTFLSTTGLSINTNTGEVDLLASTPNTYTITYATTDCVNTSTFNLTVLPLDDASFNYSSSSFCINGTNPIPTITGLIGGSFTSDLGLGIDNTTGEVDLITAISGTTYTITYTTPNCVNSSNFNIDILPLDDASFNYSSLSYCVNGTDPLPTVTGLAGGTFSSTAGLDIDASTGEIDLSASTVGNTYTVTYTTTNCVSTNTFDVSIQASDDASFNYSSVSYCIYEIDPIPTITGLLGGTFSSTAGLIINAGTGEIDLDLSIPNTYSISYTTIGVCSETSTVNFILNATPLLNSNSETFIVCDDNVSDGITEMNLTDMDDSFSGGDVNYLVTYYNSASAADAGTPEVLPSSSAYLGTDSETVFVRVEDITTGCYDASATLVLRVVDAPPANTPIQLASCDSDNDHVSSFNLNDATAGITTDPTLEVTYHLTQENAEDDVLALVEPELSTYENNIDLTQAPDNLSYSQIIWVRVDYLGSTADCPTVLPLELLVNETPDILANPPMDYELCDDDSDGFVEFNLPTRNVEILNGLTAADYQVTYYTDVADAEIGVTATSYIASPASFTNAVIDGQVLGVRVEDISGNNPDCYRSTTLEIIVNPLPVIAGRDLLLALCDNTAPMNDSMADFDLTEMDNQITGSDASLTVDYYENLADVLSNTPIADYAVYTGTANQTLQVVVTAMNGCTDRTTLTLRVLSNPSPTTAIPDTVLCDDAVADGITLFDLTDNGNGAGSQETFIINGELPRPTLTYHLEETDAELGINSIPDPTMHENTASPNSQLIYVRVTNGNVDTFGENCYTVVSFTIVVEPLPNVSGLDVADIKLIGCELDGDDLYTFDLTQNTTVLEDWLTSNGQIPSDYYISYHNTSGDAIAGISEIINTTTYINEFPGMPGVSENPQTIYVRITDGSDALGTGGTGCYLDTVNFEIEVQDGAISNQSLTDYVICDNIGTVNDGIAQFNLSSTANGDIYDYNVGHTLHADILNSNPLYVQDPLNFGISFYSTAEGAEFGVGHADELPTTYENTTSPNQQMIYVRVDNDTTTNDVCYDVSTLRLMVNPLPVLDLDESYLLCTAINGSEVITTPPTIDTGLDVANYSFVWSLDSTIQPQFNDMSSIEPTQGGTYSVLVTDRSTGCDNSISSADTYTTTVNESSPPLVVASVVTAAFATNHGIEVSAENQSTTNVISEYEFSLNDGEWQLGTGTVGGTYTHTFLDDVRLGENNIKVRDINGCGMSEINITVMDYPLYFTPNGDGIHETWNISAPESPINYLATAKIYIFDKFGKLLKQLNPSGTGWDGTYNGEAMPTSDYWFTVDYVDPLDDAQKQFKAHFTLKR